MTNGIMSVPVPKNESPLTYAPGSPEKKILKDKLAEFSNMRLEIPLIIGGKEVKTGNIDDCSMPHNHQHTLAIYHKAGAKEVAMAVEAALQARQIWSRMPWESRVAIFLKAGDLLATEWRPILNAACMLCQSKTAFQAEIDSACELIDFFRFNCHYLREIYMQQPDSSAGAWNYIEHRPLEGFVFAVTPFNFASIAGNLPSAPALMGNTVLWKPASSTVYTAYFIMKLFQAAGLPDGVINFIPGSGPQVGEPVLAHSELAGIHFTGSTSVFQGMWKTIAENIDLYESYPRIVGETGGKDFIFVHASADIEEVVTAIIRGAFEYQGQKCSAASRAYLPESMWPQLKKRLVEEVAVIKIGDPEDFTNFMGAIIDQPAYSRIVEYIDYASKSNEAEILVGGKHDDSIGYFIWPTIILTKNPYFKTMQEEIFGPVMTVYVYDDKDFEVTLHTCDKTSSYGLTGAIFSKDRQAIIDAMEILRNAAGNFYINDKPTGAVVGQQPFGGARASGTNDKAGSMNNLIRWVSQRTIKENFIPPKSYVYPHMLEP